MFTRSKAREQRELSESIEKHRQLRMKQSLSRTEEFVTPYNLRSAMVRRGANSSRGTGQRLKRGKFGDISLVRLFAMPEVDINQENTPVTVCSSGLGGNWI